MGVVTSNPRVVHVLEVSVRNENQCFLSSLELIDLY